MLFSQIVAKCKHFDTHIIFLSFLPKKRLMALATLGVAGKQTKLPNSAPGCKIDVFWVYYLFYTSKTRGDKGFWNFWHFFFKKMLKTRILGKKTLNCLCNAKCWWKIWKIIKFGLSVQNRSLSTKNFFLYHKTQRFRLFSRKFQKLATKISKSACQALQALVRQNFFLYLKSPRWEDIISYPKC